MYLNYKNLSVQDVKLLILIPLVIQEKLLSIFKMKIFDGINFVTVIMYILENFWGMMD